MKKFFFLHITYFLIITLYLILSSQYIYNKYIIGITATTNSFKSRIQFYILEKEREKERENAKKYSYIYLFEKYT